MGTVCVELQAGAVYKARFETMTVLSATVKVFILDTVAKTVEVEVAVDVWVYVFVFVIVTDCVTVG